MSNLVFPTLPGADIAIKRTPVFSTLIQTSASGKELRASFQSTPRWRYEIPLNFLRIPGFSVNTSTNEMAAILGLFNAVRGSWDNFLFSDPYSKAASATPFGTGDGSTVAFQLLDIEGFPAYDLNGTPTVFRTDWQGTYQLYSTARTNFCTKSQALDNAAWTNLIAGTGVNPTVTADYGPGPEGGTTAERVQFNQGAGTTIGDVSVRRSPTMSGLTIGQPVVVSFWAKSNTTAQSLYIGGGTLTAGNTTVTLGTTLQRYTALLGNATAASGLIYFGLRGTFTTGATADITITDFQVEQNGLGAATSFILTDATPVTVTDYSVNASGLVTLAANLATGATLAWSGGYYRRVRFDMDEYEQEQMFNLCWDGGTVKLISVK